MPYHRRIDVARESHGVGKKIGTTGRGIGPAYEDKIARVGIRLCDLLDEEVFREKLDRNVEEKNFYLTKLFGEEPIDGEAIYEEYRAYADRLRPYAADCSLILQQEIDKGKKILFEGRPGVATSTSTTAPSPTSPPPTPSPETPAAGPAWDRRPSNRWSGSARPIRRGSAKGRS